MDTPKPRRLIPIEFRPPGGDGLVVPEVVLPIEIRTPAFAE